MELWLHFEKYFILDDREDFIVLFKPENDLADFHYFVAVCFSLELVDCVQDFEGGWGEGEVVVDLVEECE